MSSEDDWYFETPLVELSDEPPSTYFDSPSHNPPGIPAVGMKWACPDGKYRCPCVCHCSYCMAGIDPDKSKRGRFY